MAVVAVVALPIFLDRKTAAVVAQIAVAVQIVVADQTAVDQTGSGVDHRCYLGTGQLVAGTGPVVGGKIVVVVDRRIVADRRQRA